MNAKEWYQKRFVTAFGGPAGNSEFTPLQITSGTFIAELEAYASEVNKGLVEALDDISQADTHVTAPELRSRAFAGLAAARGVK